MTGLSCCDKWFTGDAAAAAEADGNRGFLGLTLGLALAALANLLALALEWKETASRTSETDGSVGISRRSCRRAARTYGKISDARLIKYTYCTGLG